MAKDAFFFKHDMNASSDLKLRRLRKRYYLMVKEMLKSGELDEELVLALAAWGAQGWYWYIIESLRNEDEYYLEYSEHAFDALSEDMKCSPEHTKAFIDSCIQTYRLFQLNNNGECFFSERLSRDMADWQERRNRFSEGGKVSARLRYPKKQSDDAKIASMMKTYEEKTGQMLTPNQLEQLKDMADNCTFEEFNDALEITVNKKVKSPMPYIAKILESKIDQVAGANDGTSGRHSKATEIARLKDSVGKSLD